MSERECGPCTACCDGWLTSDKLKLKPGSPCKHCTAAGCGIYEVRPINPCRKFRCGWLKDEETLPDEMRPDLSGAIVLLDRRWHGIKIISAIPTGEKLTPETLEWLKDFAVKKSIPLIFTTHPLKDGKFDDKFKTGFGPPAFVKAVKEAIGPDDIVKF